MHAATGSALAKEALERMAELFAVEAAINGKSAEHRYAVRQERSLARLEGLKGFLEAAFGRISRKSALAGAIRYSLARWPALCRFAHDGRLEMTNNAAERAIRPLALGRKNYLFAGSDGGGRRAALLYTLVQTATLNGLDPEPIGVAAVYYATFAVEHTGEAIVWEAASAVTLASILAHGVTAGPFTRLYARTSAGQHRAGVRLPGAAP